MPRIRTIKPDHWNDRELPKISLQAHLLWIGIWNFSDDSGIIDADPLLIKSQVFPRRLDVRVEQLTQWLDQLVMARFLVPFVFNNASYYVSRTFETHQKIDRPTPSKIPKEIIRRALDEYSSKPRPCNVEESKGKESPNGLVEPEKNPVPSLAPFQIFQSLAKTKKEVFEFIRDQKPDFIEPYVALWNIFAEEKNFLKFYR